MGLFCYRLASAVLVIVAQFMLALDLLLGDEGARYISLLDLGTVAVVDRLWFPRVFPHLQAGVKCLYSLAMDRAQAVVLCC